MTAAVLPPDPEIRQFYTLYRITDPGTMQEYRHEACWEWWPSIRAWRPVDRQEPTLTPTDAYAAGWRLAGLPPVQPDTGRRFYVTIADGPRVTWAAGPYRTHAEALAAAPAVRSRANRASPWAAFWAFGTASTEPGAAPVRTWLGVFDGGEK